MMRLLERALRRAGLPVAMSEGHNPRPRISIPAPLSVGHTGRNEVADVGLRQWTKPQEFRRRLQRQLPPGIRIRSLQVTSTHPDRQPRSFSYRVPLLPDHSLEDAALRAFMEQDEAIVVRHRRDDSKRVNVREFVRALRLDADAVEMLIEFTNRGSARPEEVLQALGCDEGADFLAGQIERAHVSMSPSP